MTTKTKQKTSLTLAPDPRVTALKAKATKLLKNWQSVEVTDTPSFEAAGSALKDAVSIRKDLKTLLDPEIQEAKAAFKAKEKVFKDVDHVISDVERTIRDALSRYAAKQLEAQEKLVTKALDSGKDEKAALIAAKPFVPAVSGLSFTEHWHAEVTDLEAFVRWCVANNACSLLNPDMVTLNARARERKAEDIGYAGVKGVKETSSTIRG